jgi:hypothetical protein
MIIALHMSQRGLPADRSALVIIHPDEMPGSRSNSTTAGDVVYGEHS